MSSTFSFILIFAIFGFALTDKLRQKKLLFSQKQYEMSMNEDKEFYKKPNQLMELEIQRALKK